MHDEAKFSANMIGKLYYLYTLKMGIDRTDLRFETERYNMRPQSPGATHLGDASHLSLTQRDDVLFLPSTVSLRRVTDALRSSPRGVVEIGPVCQETGPA